MDYSDAGIDVLKEQALTKFRKDPEFRTLVLLQLRLLQNGQCDKTDLALASALAGMMAMSPRYDAIVTST